MKDLADPFKTGNEKIINHIGKNLALPRNYQMKKEVELYNRIIETSKH